MSDIADNADLHVEQLNLAAMKHKRPAGPEYTGTCANCGEPTPLRLRWCDEDCRNDWQKRTGERK